MGASEGGGDSEEARGGARRAGFGAGGGGHGRGRLGRRQGEEARSAEASSEGAGEGMGRDDLELEGDGRSGPVDRDDGMKGRESRGGVRLGVWGEQR